MVSFYSVELNEVKISDYLQIEENSRRIALSSSTLANSAEGRYQVDRGRCAVKALQPFPLWFPLNRDTAHTVGGVINGTDD